MEQDMRWFGGAVLIVLGLAGAFLWVTQIAAKNPHQAVICSTRLTAGLTHGPDAPLNLDGDLKLYVKPDLSFSGSLTLSKDNSTIPITGQGAGHGIDMIFEPEGGGQLYAHGVLETSIWDCAGESGGTLVGPNFGDHGDWTTYPPYIRVISPTLSLR